MQNLWILQSCALPTASYKLYLVKSTESSAYEIIGINTQHPTHTSLRNALGQLPEKVREKIWIAPNDCWLWIAGDNGQGYGRVRWEGAERKAHRVVYELLRGSIPEGLTLDHLCRTRSCVNPGHLEAVTLQENLLRGFGVGVINKAKTQCRNGHEFTPENTFWYGAGKRKRHCRTCLSANSKRWHDKKVSA